MKPVGLVITLLAVCWIVYAQNMSISVETGYGQSVVNFSLMQRQVIFTNIGIGAAIIGVLILLFGKGKGKVKAQKPEVHQVSEYVTCASCQRLTNRWKARCEYCDEVAWKTKFKD